MMNQPEDVLSVRPVHLEKFAVHYMMPMNDNELNQFFMDMLRRKLTRNLQKLQASVAEQLSSAIEETWGVDHENWREFSLLESIEKMTFGPASSVLISKRLSHDPHYSAEARSFGFWFGASTAIVGQSLPWFLKPLVGHILGFIVKRKQRQMLRWVDPLVTDRFEKIKRMKSDRNFDYEPPEDLITWMVDAVLHSGKPHFQNIELLSRRLAALVSTSLQGQDHLISCAFGKGGSSLRKDHGRSYSTSLIQPPLCYMNPQLTH